MVTTLRASVVLTAILVAGARDGVAQGFSNLSFEQVAGSLPQSGNGVIESQTAIPHWTPYYGGAPGSVIGYNDVSLGGAFISLQDTNAARWGLPLPLHGQYSIWFQPSAPAMSTSVGIGQTGVIPSTAKTLTFWGVTFWSDTPGFVVTFRGQALSYSALSATTSHSVYAADISAFAGQTGELLFTVPAGPQALLDNIQFSSVPVPEPGVLSLAALAGVLLMRRFRRME